MLGGLAAPLLTGDSDLRVATAITWPVAVVLAAADRLAAARAGTRPTATIGHGRALA